MRGSRRCLCFEWVTDRASTRGIGVELGEAGRFVAVAAPGRLRRGWVFESLAFAAGREVSDVARAVCAFSATAMPRPGGGYGGRRTVLYGSGVTPVTLLRPTCHPGRLSGRRIVGGVIQSGVCADRVHVRATPAGVLIHRHLAEQDERPDRPLHRPLADLRFAC